MWTKKSFTLIEILVVVVVVGILAAIGLPNYSLIKEKALDKEAIDTLALFRSAEKIYKLEHGSWYPPGGSRLYGMPISANINRELKMRIPESLSSWYYTVFGNGYVTAERSSSRFAIAPNGRKWSLNAGDDENPACTGTCL